jgi:alanyl-tRNA synthetase
LVKKLKELLRNPADLSKSVESLIEDNNRMKKELEKAVLMKASGLKDELAKTGGISTVSISSPKK